ncbi:MAG: hypothetical protein ACOCVF_01445 [bacterium]
MTRERIDKAIDVINHAIKNGISVREASEKCGYSFTYVKNVKANLMQEYEEGNVDPDDYSAFFDAFNEYNSKYHQANTTQDSDDDMILNKEIKGSKTKYEEKGGEATIEWEGINNDFSNDEEEFHRGYPNGHIKTLDQLLESCNVDKELWQVKSHIINKWDVTSWKMGYPQTWENFQVKAQLVKNELEFKLRNAEEAFKELMEEYVPPVSNLDVLSKKSNVLDDENNLLEITLFDAHIGKLTWHGETGENYDVNIATRRFMYALEMLLKRASGFNYNRILFPIGNDFFNSDTFLNTTTYGTPQDEDLRWQKTFKIGSQLLISAIDTLKLTGVPIDVIVIPGNHDQQRAFYVGEVLSAWYDKDTQVSVNNSAELRKYYKFGDVLLGFTHGNNEKKNDLPMLMATEKKELWGKTKYHEFHIGHLHKKNKTSYDIVINKNEYIDENLGVVIRTLSSIAGTDQWHFSKGYVGNSKAGEAFIWNDVNGFVANLNINIQIDDND